MSDNEKPEQTDLQRRSILEAAGMAIVGGLAAASTPAAAQGARQTGAAERNAGKPR